MIRINDYTKFIVTGVDRQGKRFVMQYDAKDYMYAFGINLWRGSVWGLMKSNGKRQLLKRVCN